MLEDRYTAFAGDRLLAGGSGAEVAAAASAALAAHTAQVLIFRDATGEQVELDPFSRTPAIAGAQSSHSGSEKRPRGRPRLGVSAREVTLLPRHWDWLGKQPGGASAALRRLVEGASRRPDGESAARLSREAAYRVLTSLAGDRPGYEEAVRALFAGDVAQLSSLIKPWPDAIRAYVQRLVATG